MGVAFTLYPFPLASFLALFYNTFTLPTMSFHRKLHLPAKISLSFAVSLCLSLSRSLSLFYFVGESCYGSWRWRGTELTTTTITSSRWSWSGTRASASRICSPGSPRTSSTSSPNPPLASSSPLGPWTSMARSSRLRFGTLLAKKGFCFFFNFVFPHLGFSYFGLFIVGYVWFVEL